MSRDVWSIIELKSEQVHQECAQRNESNFMRKNESMVMNFNEDLAMSNK